MPKIFPFLKALDAIEQLKADIAKSSLVIPQSNGTPIRIETDASGSAIGASLSQNDRPIAYFSRTLSNAEQKQSAVELEAMAVVEAFRKWEQFIRSYPTSVLTDQKAIAFIFSRQKSRIKNEKLIRWRLELSQYRYEISYRPGSQNLSADALSRIAVAQDSQIALLHKSLAHPGINRFWEYIQRHKLAFSLEEVKKCIDSCSTCKECKPRFYKPSVRSSVVRASKPFERLGIDLVGPKTPSSKSGAVHMLTVIDEYSRFPFAFPIKDTSSSSVLACLRNLFSLLGTPAFIHSDRGRQFVSSEFNSFCHENGISHSCTTPYHPSGNGQTERFNGTIWTAICCILHSQQLGLE